nr:DsbA family protein [uncultured Draconibacterium sp.]
MEAKTIKIIQFTDPVCTWCWGSEPVLRTLETRYGPQIKMSYIMGGLVKDIFSFYDGFNDIGGDPERSNRNIALHWLDASNRHGMPVEAEGFKLFSTENPSTYPQNIAYKAAQLQDEEKANRFLRRMREASAAEAKVTSTTEVLVELASEVGLDISQFLDDFINGKAKAAFEEDLYITAQHGARGFPAFLIKYGEKSIMLRGYHRYESFKSIISNLSNGKLKELKVERNKESVFEFINKYNSAAPVEVKMAFDLSDDEFKEIESSLLQKQKITKQKAGNGYFLLPRINSMVCDVETGVCSQ